MRNTRSYIDRELDLMQLDLMKASSCVGESLDALQQLFKKRSMENQCRAQSLYGEVKQYCGDVETRCVRLLVLHQPVAGDLRRIKSALSVIVDFCRIAEQAAHTAQLTPALNGFDKPSQMLARVRDMAAKACLGYLNSDAEKAEEVIKADDALDAMFYEVKTDLVNMLKRGDSCDGVLDCLLAVKYLERMGDHAVRIAAAAKQLLI